MCGKIVLVNAKAWQALENVADAVECGLRKNMPYSDAELVNAAIWLAVGVLREKKSAEEVAEVLADCTAELNQPGNGNLLYPMHLADAWEDYGGNNA